MALDANNIVEEVRKPSQYMGFGIKEFKINDISFKESSTGSLKMIYHVETTPVTFEGFVGADGALGQVGRIQSAIYIKAGSEAESDEFAKLIYICKTLGLSADVYSGVFNTIGDFTKHILPYLKGKFGRFKVCAKYYAPGKFNLQFPKFRNQMVESIDVPLSKTKLKFDENSKWDVNKDELSVNADSTNAPESSPW